MNNSALNEYRIKDIHIVYFSVTNSPDEDVPPSADIKLIAIIVGSAVFLIFIIVCVSCWCRKHRGRSEAEDETDHTPDTELALIDPLDKGDCLVKG